MIYSDQNLSQISFPIDGVGCVGLSGTGRLVDWEIFNQPTPPSTNSLRNAQCVMRNAQCAMPRIRKQLFFLTALLASFVLVQGCSSHSNDDLDLARLDIDLERNIFAKALSKGISYRDCSPKELSPFDAWVLLGPAPFLPGLIFDSADSGIYTMRFSSRTGERRESIYCHPEAGTLIFQEDKLSQVYSKNPIFLCPNAHRKSREFGLFKQTHVPRRVAEFFKLSPKELRTVFLAHREESSGFKRDVASQKSKTMLSFLNDNPLPPWLPSALEEMVLCEEYDCVWKEYCVQYLGLLALCHPEVAAETRSEILAFLRSLVQSREGAIAGTACEILSETFNRPNVVPAVSVRLLRNFACDIVCDETVALPSRILAFDVALRLGATKRDFPKADLACPRRYMPMNLCKIWIDSYYEKEYYRQIFDTIGRTVASLARSSNSGVLLFCR